MLAYRSRFKSVSGFICIQDNRKGTIAVGVFSIIQSVIWCGFTSYELGKLHRFCSRYDTQEKMEQVDIYQDKDGNEISAEDVKKRLSLAGLEKGLCASFLCLMILFGLSGGCLIAGAMTKEMRRMVLWLVTILVVMFYGSVLNVLDCQFYGFHTENSAQLIIWVVYLLLMADGYKCVKGYYTSLSDRRAGRRSHINQLRTISDEVAQIELAMAPPSYEEATVDDSLYKNPPSYETYMEQLSQQESVMPNQHVSSRDSGISIDRVFIQETRVDDNEVEQPSSSVES